MTILDIILISATFIFLILFLLHMEKLLCMNPYNNTRGYKKLKIAPYILGNGDIVYVIMHQLPISRRWVSVIDCIGIDCGVPKCFKKYKDATKYIKEHYQYVYGANKSDYLINKLYV